MPLAVAALVVFKGEYASSDTVLTGRQIKDLRPNVVRKLHPDELLFSLSFEQNELPRLHPGGGISRQYDFACQTICLNVFECAHCP